MHYLRSILLFLSSRSHLSSYSYCLPNGLYEVYLDDSLYYANSRRHAFATFYSITGDGTTNITLTGTTNASQLFDLGGVLKPVVQDDDDINKKSEDDDTNIFSNTGALVGIIIGAAVVTGVIIAGLW